MGFVTRDDHDGRRVPVLEDLPEVAGRRVLVRATFDRPMEDDPARPLAQGRARGLAATAEWLCQRGARVTACGDTGEPDAVAARARLDHLRRVVEQLSPLLAGAGDRVTFQSSPEDAGDVHRLVDDHDIFVNDTLQDSFLPTPSLTLPPARLPAAAGRTLEGDLAILDACLLDPARPFVVVLGGERSFDRLHGLQGLILRADTVLLGGGLARPMLQARASQPASGATESFLWECRSVIGLSNRVRHHLALPDDLVWQQPDGSTRVAPVGADIPGAVVDVGPLTRVRFGEVLAGAKTILWAGALGMVEQPVSTGGTVALAASLPEHASIVLGGDALVTTLQVAALRPPAAKMLSATDAAVELLKNGDLPALAALRRR